MARQYDAIVIGTGQAGPALAARLSGAGQRVAVIERGRFGGTCVNYGCTPTKALVASARAAHMARRAADFGVVIDGPVRVDMRKVKARKDEIAGASNEGVESWMKGLDGADVHEGHASFEGPRRVRVGEESLEAGQIFINVGARASVPPIEGLADSGYLTNATLLDLRDHRRPRASNAAREGSLLGRVPLPQPAGRAQHREPHDAALHQPLGDRGLLLGVQQRAIGVRAFGPRLLGGRRGGLPLGRRHPALDEGERLRRAHRALGFVVYLVTVEAEPGGVQLHDPSLAAPLSVSPPALRAAAARRAATAATG